MSGGSKTTTVQSSNSEPWSGVQPTLKKANELALNDVNADTFKASDTKTYVDHSADTLSSLDMMRNQANTGVAGLPQAQNHAAGVIASSGLQSGQNSAYNNLISQMGQQTNQQANQYGLMGQNVASVMGGQANQYGGLMGQATQAASNTNSAYDGFGNQANQIYGQQAGQYDTLRGQAANQASSQNAAYDSMLGGEMGKMAAGQHLEGNPYLDKQLSKGADDIQSRVADMAAANGRSLSSAHTDLLTDQLGDYYTNAYSNNYQNAVNNMMGAANSQANILNSQTSANANNINTQSGLIGAQAGAQGNALSTNINLAGQQLNNSLNALNNEAGLLGNQTNTMLQGYNAQKGALDGQTNTQMTGLSQQGNILNSQTGAQQAGDSLAMQAGQGLGSLYEAGLSPASTLGQVGSAVEEQNRMQLQDTLDKESANKNASMNYANWLNGIGAGAGQFGSTTQTAQQPSQPWWQTAAGLGLSAGSLFL